MGVIYATRNSERRWESDDGVWVFFIEQLRLHGRLDLFI